MHIDVICDNSNINGKGQSCIGAEILYTIEDKVVLVQNRL